jgi:hypothetical protein
MTRYIDDDGSLREVFDKVVKDNFPFMVNATVKLMYDTKKKVSRGRVILGTCKLARDMEKFLTKNEVEYGYDFFIIMDFKAWSFATDDDRVRLMRHECRHMTTNNQGDFALLPHDVEDFSMEISLNSDKALWAVHLAEITEAAYDQEKEAAKNPPQGG